MTAHDPVAVLREAADLLPEWSAGRDALNMLAMRLEIGAAGVGRTCDSLAVADVWPSRYTADERAAFALAREALGAGEVAR
jgi:hypothetical protein